jgi:hypothetical protein
VAELIARYPAAMPRLPLLLLLLLLAPTPALAAEPTDLAGSWVYDEASGGREARAAAIEERVAHFPRLLRGIARKRLTAAVTIRTSYGMTLSDGSILITSDANADGWSSDLVGTPVALKTVKGEDVTLARRWEDGALRSRVDSERGWTTFVFRVDGERMTIDIQVFNDQLDAPLTYQLGYRRP